MCIVLHEEGSFDEAVKGCDGVFHVAASMEFNVHEKEDIEDYVQSNILDLAIKGTLNLLKSCFKSNSVKRVVFTSSISTLTAKDSNEKWKSIVDESCQIDTDHVWNTKASGWNGIDLVSVITTTVAGPFFTTNVPSSVKVVLSPITGENEFSNILSAVNERMGSIASVHIEDICRAHIFLMEHAKAEGRFICSSQSCPLSKLVNLLAKEYSYSNIKRIAEKRYAYGGLSELPESEYFFCSMGPSIAVEIGVFGYRPSVLMAMLAGKRAEVGTKVGAYMRTFFGDCSPTDVETSLQIEMTSL
ncbi:hypothetical protein RIF29_20707 [Crotalaria pallida]|uniref:NAD-dependent epimerase/dehydratase domain-containing protein n=1 Tax=Crotalaria pallida TaxID=3830 RepID=A0AAN9F3H1_CROPI